LPFGLAASFAPKREVNVDSTAFLISSGSAQRRPGVLFTPLMVLPRLAQPVTVSTPDEMYSDTSEDSLSGVIEKPIVATT
jgi:hypothetical protein